MGSGEVQDRPVARPLLEKVIAVVGDENVVRGPDVAEAKGNEVPLAKAVLIEPRDALGVAREVFADKGVDSDAVRDVVLDELDAPLVVPNRRCRTGPWSQGDDIPESCKPRKRGQRTFVTRREKLKDV